VYQELFSGNLCAYTENRTPVNRIRFLSLSSSLSLSLSLSLSFSLIELSLHFCFILRVIYRSVIIVFISGIAREIAHSMTIDLSPSSRPGGKEI